MFRKRNLVIAILAASLLLAVANVTHAASELEKETAIANGLTWLATQQQGDGHWEYGSTEYDIAATGAALLAFIEEGSTPTSGPYSTEVALGLNYLFANAQTVDITVPVTPAGDPDINGNGIGLKFVLGGNNNRDIYCTGLALCPIAAVGAGTVSVAGSQVDGWSYAQVIQDTADYLAFAQEEAGNARGGWRYWANYGSADNSTSQWPTVGLLYAQSAGATVPAFVASELAIWANHIQNADGGSDYPDNKTWGSNVSRTGTLLIQKVFAGVAAGIGPALNYLNNQWLTTQNITWDGNFGHPYAMWASYKGLQLTITLNADLSWINNLHPDPGDVDNPNHGYNWWEDYCEYLVNTQAGGTWPGYSHWTGPIATAWYINILAATPIPPPHIEVAVDIKPTSCPNPLNVKSNGVLPVAIVGTEKFDVTTVDPASVRLIGVAPLRSSLEDVVTPFEPFLDKESEFDCTEEGPDGFLDLTLKFDIQEIVEALGEVNDGEVIVLPLIGNLYDGTPIVGEDVVIILKKGK